MAGGWVSWVEPKDLTGSQRATGGQGRRLVLVSGVWVPHALCYRSSSTFYVLCVSGFLGGKNRVLRNSSSRLMWSLVRDEQIGFLWNGSLWDQGLSHLPVIPAKTRHWAGIIHMCWMKLNRVLGQVPVSPNPEGPCLFPSSSFHSTLLSTELVGRGPMIGFAAIV
jgi:hypothetical protein